MATKTLHFKNLRRALGWRKHHKRWRISKVTVVGNPPLKKPAAHTGAELVQKIVGFCHSSLSFRGRMYYTMTGARVGLFHRQPGDFQGAECDCSQYGSSILHWCGIRKATDTDATGSMLQKYKHIQNPKVGCGVVFGAAPGEHFAFITEKDKSGVYWTVGFGHQGGPDRVSLPNMKSYFAGAGHPGVTYLDFTS